MLPNVDKAHNTNAYLGKVKKEEDLHEGVEEDLLNG